MKVTPETLTYEDRERIWADAYAIELRRLLDSGLRTGVAQQGARAHARLVLSDAINARNGAKP